MVDWEDIYAAGGHDNRWPYDVVVQFVMRHRPGAGARLVELGFGTGNNLWFAQQEGLEVAGVELSATAVEIARKRLGPAADLHVGSFAPLPFGDAAFELAVDRASLSCVGREEAATAVREVHRVLAPGGRFLFTPYSAAQTAREGYVWPSIEFYGASDIDEVLGDGWIRRSTDHAVLEREDDTLAEWRVVVEKT